MFGIHKDQEPTKTVQRVQGILQSLNIQTYEDNWAQTSDFSYSFTLHDADFPLTRTGGKGATRALALFFLGGLFVVLSAKPNNGAGVTVFGQDHRMDRISINASGASVTCLRFL